MAFAEIRFPTDISYGSSGGPEYSTDIVEIASGHEQRNSNWSQARARYNVAHGVRSKAQLEALISFFRARKGRAYGFRFKDWADYSAINSLIATGDGVTTTFQLVKHYTSGSITETRNIHKPVSGSVTIYVDAVEQTSGITVDATTGVITFSSAPADESIITSDFEFDVPVRFATDRLSSTLDSYASHSWYDIPLIEIRP